MSDVSSTWHNVLEGHPQCSVGQSFPFKVESYPIVWVEHSVLMHLSVGTGGSLAPFGYLPAAARNMGIQGSQVSDASALVCIPGGGIRHTLVETGKMASSQDCPWPTHCRQVLAHLSEGLQGTKSWWCRQLFSRRPRSSATVYFHGHSSSHFPYTDTTRPCSPQRPLRLLFLFLEDGIALIFY